MLIVKSIRGFEILKLLAKNIVLCLVIFSGFEVVLACSACIRDIMSPEEFDKRSWDSAEHVFLGLVTKSELVFITGSLPEVVYQVTVEETFKGNPNSVTKVYSRRIVNDWKAGIEEVGCGDITIGSGDRVLLFSRPDSTAYIGTCSSSRVIEGVDAEDESDVRSTLGRLRQWQTNF